MSSVKLQFDTANNLVINKDATLANAARAAGNYDNSSNLDLEAIAFLEVQYDGGPPTANTIVAELYCLPSDGTLYPDGGDGTVGEDDTPQQAFLVGVFETINPSTSTNEELACGPFRLYEYNRLVIVNKSGQTFDATWQMTIQPFKRQVV